MAAAFDQGWLPRREALDEVVELLAAHSGQDRIGQCGAQQRLGCGLEPEGNRMTAASIYGSPPKLLCGGNPRVEPVSRGVRPVSSVKERTKAAEECGGVWVRAPTRGSQR